MLKQISKPLNERPLASFCVMTFLFLMLRLYFPSGQVFFAVFTAGVFLIVLNLTKNINNFITVFILLSMVLGVLAATGGKAENESIINTFSGETVRITGEIASVPDKVKGNKLMFFVNADTVDYKKGVYNKPLKVCVNCESDVPLNFGDRITFNCTLSDPKNINSELSNYYMAKGAPLLTNSIILLSVAKTKAPIKMVTNIRNYIISTGEKFFSGDTAALYRALAAGDKTAFSVKLTDSLSKSGLSHIACVSGLHVCVLGMVIYNLLRKKNRILSAVCSVCVTYLFAFITGASPSTLRAAVMFTSYMAAKLAIRENDSVTAVSFSAMLLTLINPYVVYDWGFILSFLSVLGIEIFSDFFKTVLKFLPSVIAEPVAITLSAQIMTIPVTINMFGYISVYSVLSNIAVSFVFVYALYLCFAFTALSFIPYLNTFAAVLCAFSLDIIIETAKFFANLPLGVIYADSFDIFELICYYIMVLIFVNRKKLSAYLMGAGVLLCCGILIVSKFINAEKAVLTDNGAAQLYDVETATDNLITRE